MRQLIRENVREPTAPIVQPELNEDQSEEGNYSRAVTQAAPRVIRRNDPAKGVDRSKYKYKDYMN